MSLATVLAFAGRRHYRVADRVATGVRAGPMILVAIAWIYVVMMAAVVEATSDNGTVLGAVVTFLLYGVLPLGIVLYLMLSPARRRKRRDEASGAALDPDQGGHPTGEAVAPEREEP